MKTQTTLLLTALLFSAQGATAAPQFVVEQSDGGVHTGSAVLSVGGAAALQDPLTSGGYLHKYDAMRTCDGDRIDVHKLTLSGSVNGEAAYDGNGGGAVGAWQYLGLTFIADGAGFSGPRGTYASAETSVSASGYLDPTTITAVTMDVLERLVSDDVELPPTLEGLREAILSGDLEIRFDYGGNGFGSGTGTTNATPCP